MLETPKARYLVCTLTTPLRVEYDYTPISQDIEKKIEGLIRTQQLPKEFVLNKKKIVSETILGFTDKPILHQIPKAEPKIKSWDELRSFVKEQQWYKKAQAKNAQVVKPDFDVSSNQSLL